MNDFQGNCVFTEWTVQMHKITHRNFGILVEIPTRSVNIKLKGSEREAIGQQQKLFVHMTSYKGQSSSMTQNILSQYSRSKWD